MDTEIGRWWRALAALVAALATFGVVALAVTAVLDPYVWPSAVLGLPAGAVAAVVAFLLVRRLARRPARG
jgi:hypothetical protein